MPNAFNAVLGKPCTKPGGKAWMNVIDKFDNWVMFNDSNWLVVSAAT